MCRPTKEKTLHSNAGKTQFPWTSVICPCIAGLLHLHVFYISVVHLVLPSFSQLESLKMDSNEKLAQRCYMSDRVVIIAYLFDLLCCYCFKVIPFSRCNSSMDIVGHHIPVLCVLIPLGVHLWAHMLAEIRFVDPISFAMMDLDIGSMYRTRFIEAGFKANGLGFISSLNEAFMCFQRAEMSLNEVHSFREIPRINRRFFTSRVIIGIELYFKLCIFWVFSVFSFKVACDLHQNHSEFIGEMAEGEEPAWRTMLLSMKSLCVIRSIIFRVFILVLYPSMGMRTFKKIKQFHREGGLHQKLQLEKPLLAKKSI